MVICKTVINNREILVFSLSRVEGATFLDIRIFQRTESPEGRLTPTNKGASYPVDDLEKTKGTYAYMADQAAAILKGLAEAETFLVERGILQAPEPRLNPWLKDFTKVQGWK